MSSKDAGHAFPNILDLCAHSLHLFTAEILYDEQLQRLKTTFEAAFMTSYQLKLWTNLYELERSASKSVPVPLAHQRISRISTSAASVDKLV